MKYLTAQSLQQEVQLDSDEVIKKFITFLLLTRFEEEPLIDSTIPI